MSGGARVVWRPRARPVPAVESIARYGWAAKVLEGVVTRPAERPQIDQSDRIDRYPDASRLGARWSFVAVMLLMFQAVFFVAEPASARDRLAQRRARRAASRKWFPKARSARSLTTGVIGGVGAVLVFLPQIFILFFFIAILEDCGYMARAAYLMDRLMSRMGLSGQVVHPAAVVVRLRDPGRHGDARDREPPRPADDDPGRPADELQRPAAGLHAADRGLHPRPAIVSAGCSIPGCRA